MSKLSLLSQHPEIIVEGSQHINRRILFQHLMKTGGTSVVAMLNNFLRTDASREYMATGAGSHARRYVRAMRATFLHDHSYILHLRSRDCFAFTIVREPFARLLSARRQWTDASDADLERMQPRSARAVVAMRSLTLDRILEIIFDYPFLIPWFWNHQATTLGVWPLTRATFPLRPDKRDVLFPNPRLYRAWLERNRSNILKTALSNLHSLDFVGLNEEFEVSVREIFTRIGLPAPEFALHYNPRAAHPDELDSSLRSKAKPFLELDYEIYEEARELFARRSRFERGAPVDYIGRRITPLDDKNFGADEVSWRPRLASSSIARGR